MKCRAFALTWLVAIFSCSADVFIGSSNTISVLAVPTNQTLLISSVKIGAFDPIYGADTAIGLLGKVLQNGVTNTLSFSYALSGPYAVTGACQLWFVRELTGQTSAAPVVVSYKLIQSPAIRSFIATPGSTNTISIPAGKSLRFLTPTQSGGQSQAFTTQQGAALLYDVRFANGDELTGPLTLTYVLAAGETYSQLISYYFTEDFLVVPQTGYLQGPSGAFEISVEKSVDLFNWYPAVVYGTSTDQKAFYRLKILK